MTLRILIIHANNYEEKPCAGFYHHPHPPSFRRTQIVLECGINKI